MIDIENNYNDLKHLYEKAKKELPQGTESQIARVEEEKRELLSLFETKRSEGKALPNDYKNRCEDLEVKLSYLQTERDSALDKDVLLSSKSTHSNPNDQATIVEVTSELDRLRKTLKKKKKKRSKLSLYSPWQNHGEDENEIWNYRMTMIRHDVC